ncbi:MAG: hypothetical protein ABIM59_07160 [candidate division WOR-3 bacterium]
MGLFVVAKISRACVIIFALMRSLRRLNMKKALAGLALAAGVALATEARVEGMGGIYGYILDDEALVILSNPAWAGYFTGRSVLELNSQDVYQAGGAYGGILFNMSSFAMGLYLNNPIYEYPLATGDYDMAHGFTFALGSTGEGMKWGVRLGAAMEQYGDTSYTIKGTQVKLAPGVLLPLGDATIDAVLMVDAGLHSDDSQGDNNVLEPISPLDRIALGVRYIGAGDFKWIYGLGVYMTDYGTKQGNTEDVDKTMGGGLNIGFNTKPTENSLIGGGLSLSGFQWKDTDTTSSLGVSLTASLGGELGLNDWFILRGGLNHSPLVMYNDDPDKEIGGSGLAVSLGAGIAKGPVRFDATVSEDLLYNWPYFLTGNTSSAVGKLALLYQFRTQ